MVKRKKIESGFSSPINNKRKCFDDFNGHRSVDITIFKDFNNGDIIQAENNGKHEYMIFEYYNNEKTCPLVYYAIQEEVHEPLPQSWSSSISQWLFGPKRKMWFETPKGLDKTMRIDVEIRCATNILLGKKFRKYNIADECLAPNDPDTIIERAEYKSFGWLYPQFSTGEDWAIWCRYDKDIVAHTGIQK